MKDSAATSSMMVTGAENCVHLIESRGRPCPPPSPGSGTPPRTPRPLRGTHPQSRACSPVFHHRHFHLQTRFGGSCQSLITHRIRTINESVFTVKYFRLRWPLTSNPERTLFFLSHTKLIDGISLGTFQQTFRCMSSTNPSHYNRDSCFKNLMSIFDISFLEIPILHCAPPISILVVSLL